MSTEFLIMAVIAVISYFIGSISTAILVGKILGGDDIRSHGSGNAGATNALRTDGKAAAVLKHLFAVLSALSPHTSHRSARKT